MEIDFIDKVITVQLNKVNQNKTIDLLNLTKIIVPNLGLLISLKNECPYNNFRSLENERGNLIVIVHPTINADSLEKYKNSII
jgi:hypothetical protein